MNKSRYISDRLREVMLDGRWVANTNYHAALEHVSREMALHRIGSLNTIALLTFHINYYIAGLLRVLDGGPLDIRDKYSFDMPPVVTDEDWNNLKDKFFADAAQFVAKVASLTDDQLEAPFIDEKYGSCLRNMDAMIEHCYYHLGQIVLIRKILENG